MEGPIFLNTPCHPMRTNYSFHVCVSNRGTKKQDTSNKKTIQAKKQHINRVKIPKLSKKRARKVDSANKQQYVKAIHKNSKKRMNYKKSKNNVNPPLFRRNFPFMFFLVAIHKNQLTNIIFI